MLAGDALAFETLYERRQGAVYRYALRMSGSHTLAEDVTQDVFIALVRDGGQFDAARGSLAGYLYGMARHRVLRRLEKERTLVPLVDEMEEMDAPEDEGLIVRSDLLEGLSRAETIETVRQAILALPAHYREVVVLCHLQEMNYAQAAEVIGCAIGTVRSRLHRARAILIEKLRGEGEGVRTHSGAPARYVV